MLRGTEELVRQARMTRISHEHRSIGDILDNRNVYELEEPRKRPKKTSMAEIERRIYSRRGGKGENEVKDDAENAIDAFKDQGVNAKLLDGSYDLEVQIWKSKSAQLTYTQKRKFYFPELEEFREQMTPTQKKLFKDQIYEMIIKMADKFRAEFNEMKIDLDLNGIFHPDVNAHRVHCMYLMKLYKEILSENIEDVILRKFRNEQLEKKRIEKITEEQREKFLKIANAANDKKDKKNDFNNVITDNSLLDEDPTAPINSKANHSSANNKTDNKSRKKVRIPLHSSKSQSNLEPIKTMTSNRKKLEPIDKPTGEKIIHSSTMPNLTSPSPNNNSNDNNNNNNNNNGNKYNKKNSSLNIFNTTIVTDMNEPNEDETSQNQNMLSEKVLLKAQQQNDALFKKIKKGRLGNSDARTLLIEEAIKLDKAETIMMKKGKDKNNLLDSEMSNWMVSNLQKSQISKTAGGNALLSSSTSLIQSKYQPSSYLNNDLSKILLEFTNNLGIKQNYKNDDDNFFDQSNDDDNNNNNNNNKDFQNQKSYGSDPMKLMNLSTSPSQKILPFDDFYNMFKTFSENKDKEAQPEIAAKDPIATGATDDDKIKKKQGLLTDALMNTNNQMSSASPLPIKPNNITITTSSPINNNNKVEPSNAIKILMEADPQFESFLKIAGKELPVESTTAKIKSNLLKPKRVKNIPPLGRDAIYLTDSRGRISKLSNKGFTNHFKMNEAENDSLSNSMKSNGDIIIDDDASYKQPLLSPHDLVKRISSIDLDAEVGLISPINNHDVIKNNDHDNNDSQINSNSRRTFKKLHNNDDNNKHSSDQQRIKSRNRNSNQNKLNELNKVSLLATETDINNDPQIYMHDPSNQYEFQDKILCIWDSLQISSNIRFEFMQKFSTAAYSVEMSHAVDLWGEATVLIIAITESVAFMKKLKSTEKSVPLSALRTRLIKNNIKDNFRLSLKSYSNTNTPTHHKIGNNSYNYNNSSNDNKNKNNNNNNNIEIYDNKEAVIALSTIIDDFVEQLIIVAKRMRDDVDELLLISTRPYKEWLKSMTGRKDFTTIK
eukprot:gene10993-14767_t